MTYTAQDNRLYRAVRFLAVTCSFIFIIYVLTDLRKGGDFKYLDPYLSFIFTIRFLYLARDRRMDIFRTGMFHLLALYVVVSYLILPFSVSPAISFRATNREILAGLFLFVVASVHSAGEERRKKTVIFLVAVLIFIIAGGYYTYIERYFSGHRLGTMNPDIKFSLVKFRLHHNGFAMVVNLLLPFLFLAIYSARNKTWKAVLVVISLLAVTGVFLSLSRGGWASLLLIFILWFLLDRERQGRRMKAAIVSVVALVAALSLIAFISPTVKKRIIRTTRDIKTFHSRTDIWKHTIDAIRTSPLVGFGYGNRIIWKNKPIVIDEKNMERVPKLFRVGSHNTVLHVMFHQGLIGTFFYLVFFGFFLFHLLRRLIGRNAGYYRETSSLFLNAVACSFFSVLVLHSLIEIVPFTYTCLVAGLLAGFDTGN